MTENAWKNFRIFFENLLTNPNACDIIHTVANETAQVKDANERSKKFLKKF